MSNLSIGQSFSDLSRAYRNKWAKIDQLRKPCDDECQVLANGYKVSLLQGTYNWYPEHGHTEIQVRISPYSLDDESKFNRVKALYGLFEDTWLEVKRGTGNDETFTENIEGDKLSITIHWGPLLPEI